MKIGIDIDDTVMDTQVVIDKAALYFDKNFANGKGYQDKNKYDFHEKFYWSSVEKKEFFQFFHFKRHFSSPPTSVTVNLLTILFSECDITASRMILMIITVSVHAIRSTDSRYSFD